MDEIADIEEQLDELWPHLSASAQTEIDKRGVVYPDPEGELVTCIVNNRDCAFRGPHGCLLRQRPISCHLYPIRLVEKDGFTHILYHEWSVCVPAKRKGERDGIPLWKFLREPMIRKFGEDWYNRLEKMIQK